MHAFPLTLDNRLADALPLWRNLARTDRAPRRNIDLADWKADWRELIAALDRFSQSHGYRQPFAAQGHAALENAWAWGQAAENASTLLLKAIDRGLAGAELRSIYLETAALWLDYSRLLGAARDSLREQGEVDFETAPALAPRTGQYPFALQLLAMGVLLDAQELIPALVEDVLQFDTDRLLDYLGAAALGLTSASEETFHPRPFGQLRAFFEVCLRHDWADRLNDTSEHEMDELKHRRPNGNSGQRVSAQPTDHQCIDKSCRVLSNLSHCQGERELK